MNKRTIYAGLFLTGLLILMLFVVASGGTARANTGMTPLPHETAHSQASALELLAQVGGQIASVVSDGTYLYANSGRRLAILTAVANPQLIGRSDPLPAAVQSVAVSGETVVVTTGEVLFTLDAGDPSQPTIVGTLPLDIAAGTLLASGSYAYAVGDHAILIVDIGNPAQPQLAGTTAEQGEGWTITAAAIDGDLLLVREIYEYCSPHYGCDYDYEYLFIDVSVPTQPELLATFPSSLSFSSMVLDGGFAFVIEYNSFRLLDVRDPANPAWLGYALIPDDSRTIGAPVIDNGLAYVWSRPRYASDYDQLLLYNVSTPTAPELIAVLSIPIRGRAQTLAGDLLAVTSGCGVSMVDPLNVIQPVAGTYADILAAGENGSMLVDGNVLYSGTGESSFGTAGSCLQTVDSSDAAAPSLLWSLDFGAPIFALQKVDNLLYVGESKELYVFDVTQPASPVLLSVTSVDAIEATMGWKFAVAGETVCVCRDEACSAAVFFLDAGDPQAPHWVGSYPLPDPSDDYTIAATPGTLYLLRNYVNTGDAAEMFVVDVHDPASPSLEAVLPPASFGWLDGVAVDFPDLYIHRGEQLAIVNVLDPGHPRRTATLSPVDGIMTLTTNVAYFVGPSLVTAYTMPPFTPHPFITTAAWCAPGCGWDWSSAAQQDLLFIGERESGLLVYRFTPPAVQAVFFPEVEQ